MVNGPWVIVFTGVGNGGHCPGVVSKRQQWCNWGGVCFLGNNGGNGCPARLCFSPLVKYGDVTDSGSGEVGK